MKKSIWKKVLCKLSFNKCKQKKEAEQAVRELEIQANRTEMHLAAEQATVATEKLNHLLENPDTAYIIYLATKGKGEKNGRI